MTAKLRLLAFLLLPLEAAATAEPAGPGAPPAIQSESDVRDRFYRGREVIVAAVEAAGGAQAVRGLNGLAYELDGTIFNDIQGYSASRIGNPVQDGRQRIRNLIDWSGSRFSQTVFQRLESGYDSGFATIWRDGILYSPRWIPRDFGQASNSPSPFLAGGAVMVSSRWMPPVILKRALQNVRSAYWVGTGDVAGEPTDIVDFSFDEIARFRIHVQRSNRQIRRVETIAPDPITADDTTVANFEGDQVVGGLHFPQRVRASRRGFVNQDFAIRAIAANPAFTPADFAPPDGFAKLPDAPSQLATTRIAGRVYEVSGLAGGAYRVPFVVMADYVVAYEAPLGIAQTRQVIAEIRKVAANKPIRYVVVSHFHADHAGGIGAYAEEGATVLSSQSNEAVLQTYARANRPQSQGLEGVRPDLTLRFAAVPDAGMVLTDSAGGKLEIVDFPGNSHVEHMLALVDRESGVFMGADHFITAVTWNRTFEAVARWVRRNPAIATLLGVHNEPLARPAYLAVARGLHPSLE
jgi:glyoxylase-like metal-dependent hydrolase (beta-lactamase superfamily II)